MEHLVSRKGARYGVVLAGGEGRRLQRFVRRLRGDALPKQYVTFLGTRSMLEHTWDRAERLLPRERVLTIITRSHLGHPEVRRHLASRPPGTIIIQPENKDTGPGVLLPLVHLRHRDPDAVVAIFPSDHCIVEESLFAGYVDLAFRAVERDPSCMVLLGVEPDGPEEEYGYLVPEDGCGDQVTAGLPRIARFVEKPAPHAAQPLVAQGALWNTMVMVCQVHTLFSCIARVTPTLHAAFGEIGRAIGTPHEHTVLQDIYRRLEPANFSRQVMEPLASLPDAALVMASMRGVGWSDWGSEERIVRMLDLLGWRDRLRLAAFDGGETTTGEAEAARVTAAVSVTRPQPTSTGLRSEGYVQALHELC
jgi:mannose-1-phosphate guanylyltransferase